MVVQPDFRKQINHAAARPSLGIGRSKDQIGDSRVHDGAGTHDTRLQSGVQGAFVQSVIAKRLTRFSQSLDFRMSTGITTGNWRVAPSTDNDPLPDHNGTDRDLPCQCGLVGQAQGLLHHG